MTSQHTKGLSWNFFHKVYKVLLVYFEHMTLIHLNSMVFPKLKLNENETSKDQFSECIAQRPHLRIREYPSSICTIHNRQTLKRLINLTSSLYVLLLIH